MVMNLYGTIVLATVLVSLVLETTARWLNLARFELGPPLELEDLFPPEEYRRSQDYARDRSRLSMVASLCATTLFLAFWALGGFGWLDLAVRSLGWSSIPSGVLYIGLLVAASGALSLPFSLYGTFVIEERYGFNKTTWRTWLADRLKGLLLGVALGVPLLIAVLWTFERLGGRAWLVAWAVVATISLILQWLVPRFVLPLFHKFVPLEEGELRTALDRYARSVRFPLEGIYVIDGSRRSSKANAFFTGFGRHKRIALFDTLVERHSTDELVAVLSHEVGHYKRHHILLGTVLSILQTGLTLFLLGVFIGHRGLFEAFSVQEPSVAVGLVLFGLLIAPLDTLLSIGANALSRRFEFQADRFVVETAERPAALIDALKRMSKEHLAHLRPHPMVVVLEYSHPPLLQRVQAIEAALPQQELEC